MKARRGSGGFLLIEVLISMLLLAVAAAGSAALLGSVFFSTSFAGAMQTATRLGQDVLDRTLLEPFATLGAAGTSACRANEVVFANGGPASSGPGDNIAYTRSCAVTPIAAGLGAGMKVIRVTVTFNDAQNALRTVRLGLQRAN